MERTLISWNVPNLITVPLMAFAGFVAVAVIWQLVMRMRGGGGGEASTAGGY